MTEYLAIKVITVSISSPFGTELFRCQRNMVQFNAGNDLPKIVSHDGHHLTGDDSKFSSLRGYKGNTAFVTADNSVHHVVNEGAVIVSDKDNRSITLDSVYHVPGMKKYLLSMANAVDAGHYVLFAPKDVKFLWNVEDVKGDVTHVGKRVKDLYVLSASSSYVDKMSNNDGVSVWHARLGHVGIDKLKAMVSRNLVNGLPSLSFASGVEVCEGCQYGKSHRLPFEKFQSRCKGALELIHGDLMGPTQNASYEGARYMLILVDNFTRYTWVYFLKVKREAFSKFREFRTMIEGRLGKRIKKFRTDNGGEFTSKGFLSFCERHGIKKNLTCANTLQQNGVAERKIRHLVEVCRSWVYANNLPKALWAEGMACSTYVVNRLPCNPINMKSPHELMFDEKPSVKYLKVFGCMCLVHVSDEKRTKLDAKARKCVFIGYHQRKKGWKCMDSATHKFIVSRDMVFDEASSLYGDGDFQAVVSNLPTQPVVHVGNPGVDDMGKPSKDPRFSSPTSTVTSSSEMDQGNRGSNEVQSQEEENTQALRRSTRTVTRPARYRDENFVSTYSCFFSGSTDGEPSCFEEAKGNKSWEDAMDEEMQALRKNKTWNLVPKPKRVDPVTCKWVYKLKCKADGSVECYKARLVARGFSQRYGEDYEETFSPIAKMTSVRVVISMAASLGWKLWQLDVKNAFLYGELDKEIYMEQPVGYISKAPRAWYDKIAEYLQFCGYSSSSSDHSLFVKRKAGLHVVVLLYVDDMIITGNDEGEVARLRGELSIRFEMKDLGELSHFLGLEVEGLKDGYFVSQTGYAGKLIEKFGVKEGKHCSTPLDANFKLRHDDGKVLSDPRKFRALVGSLIYLTITRPDIAFVVGLVSRFMQAPTKSHLDAAKRILKYVSSTLDLGLFYKKGSEFVLHGYTDADMGGDLDDRRSTSEYKASSLAEQECVWLRRLVEDVYNAITGPTVIRDDNQSALKLATNPVRHERTKHIEIEHHFIHEKVLDGIVGVEEVRSVDNVADIFTKSLSKGSFELLRAKLGLVTKCTLRGNVKI
ncbi:hypothetical protein LUZ60_017571 [Juncus effusus]|nr:hypothetical protein LUZ60_017571 [Juncus effusus]